jgi:hypothetical protein
VIYYYQFIYIKIYQAPDKVKMSQIMRAHIVISIVSPVPFCTLATIDRIMGASTVVISFHAYSYPVRTYDTSDFQRRL